ncbi:MAG: DUF58 domain-containing protein [Bacteroidetes bacterium]|nr:MAG: DUF58 domain-containing protein [Bacteroidota bacterium]
METVELLKQVRRVEIKSRGLSDKIFSGEYASAFKGRGMAFSENREYQHGDEVRSIDWNVTARMGTPYVKVFEEERELTVFILADISGSIGGGTRGVSRRDRITELAAVLAFSAMGNNDKVGAILFSDRIEKFIPPKKGRSHVLRIIREVLEIEPEGKGTDLTNALDHFLSAMKKRTVAFLLSDFRDSGYEDLLKRAGRKHDFVALKIEDPIDLNIPNVGWLPLKDPESGDTKWIRTGSKKSRLKYKADELERSDRLKKVFARAGVDSTTIRTDMPYVKPLMQLFDRRG